MNPSCILLDIAGICIEISGAATISVLEKTDGFMPFVSSSQTHPDIFFKGDSAIPPLPAAQPFHSFMFENFDTECSLYRSSGNFFMQLSGNTLSHDYIACWKNGDNAIYANTPTDTMTLRYGLWQSLGAVMLAGHGKSAIHSSAIEYNGKAVLFLGESGTGKSTHTRLWCEHICGASLLNDDSPWIGTENGTVTAYGSPWSGKTPCFRQKSLPVTAIVRLSQAPFNRISELGKIEAIGALLPSMPPAFQYDPELQDATYALISGIIGSIPLFHLECLPDSAAVNLCKSTIFGHD